MSFNVAPTASESSNTFVLAANESITLSMFTADGKGLLPGAVGLIQKLVATGPDVYQNYDALTWTRDACVFDAEGSWRLFKAASAQAVGLNGSGP